MRGGLAWLDRECQDRFDKTFIDCTEAERTAGARRHRMAAEGAAGDVARRRVLQQLPRPHRQRILDEQDGHQGPRSTSGNVFVPEWKGCPDEALKKLGLVVSYMLPATGFRLGGADTLEE